MKRNRRLLLFLMTAVLSFFVTAQPVHAEGLSPFLNFYLDYIDSFGYGDVLWLIQNGEGEFAAVDIYWLIDNDCLDMAGAQWCVDHGLVPPDALQRPALQEPKTKPYSVYGLEDPNKGQQPQQSTPAPAAESAPAQETAAAPASEAPTETAEETGAPEETAVTETSAAETETETVTEAETEAETAAETGTETEVETETAAETETETETESVTETEIETTAESGTAVESETAEETESVMPIAEEAPVEEGNHVHAGVTVVVISAVCAAVILLIEVWKKKKA